MAITYTPYNTSDLIGFYGVIDKPNNFLFDTFFKDTVLFESAQVGIDRAERSRRMAGLRNTAQDQGELSAFADIATEFYQPAKIKVKTPIIPSAALRRRGGENFNGELSPVQRRDIMVMQAMETQSYEIGRREEFMAAEALVKGYVTLSGEGTVNPLTVSMQRPVNNYINLAGTSSAWTATGIDPLRMLNTWSTAIQKSSGKVPKVVIMDPLAYDTFLHSPGIFEIMTAFNQGNGYLDLAGAPIGGIGNEVSYNGKVGNFFIYSYQSYWSDNAGVTHQMLPDNTVIMGDPVGAAGMRLYGAIEDASSLMAVTRYPSSWYSPDNGMEFVQTQSAPLVTLGWAQATFCATVA